MSDYFIESIKLHQNLKGKIGTYNKTKVETMEDLSLVYSPGVAGPCLEIKQKPERAYDLTMKANTVAIVSDGSAVLGLGNIGPLAAIPVMEGKAMLFKKFADINAFPICLNTEDVEEIIQTVKNIAPVFGGINLEDISAPRCFEIEDRLQQIGIPVFHDDQHGTAIVTLAGIINSCKAVNKELSELNIVINGAGAAGMAIAKIMRCVNQNPDMCTPVKNIIVCDSKGIISSERNDLTPAKKELLGFTNSDNVSGSLQEALKFSDVFVGVSKGNILTEDDIKRMHKNPIIFALANPIPEISPELALKAGAAIVATGRSDYPNQVNNLLVFPGIFKAALAKRATQITSKMKIAAAIAIASMVENPSQNKIIPHSLDEGIVDIVNRAVQQVI
ncbi:MAG: NAD-dependent malic enzyme [Bacteroidetes bacterium HGW-Bacteroidetes-1]|jgi:malate dehydrogenase (oxaloacetate-decarboxylating)|nr:MAG: NAD-dependent malic enzyme [Bacteroidetes bacterium HGW-Bacteroidetes-1]